MDILHRFAHTFFATHGRLSRRMWWISNLIIWALVASTTWTYAKFGFHDAIFGGIVTLFAFWMRVSVNVKRLHDQNKSGWWILFSEIPIIGWIYGFLVFGCFKGDEGENKHGSVV